MMGAWRVGGGSEDRWTEGGYMDDLVQKNLKKCRDRPGWRLSLAQECFLCVCCALTLCAPMSCSLPAFFAHGIFQARILEWVDVDSITKGKRVTIQ